LALAVSVHGGLERWNSFRTLEARMSVGGGIFAAKQNPGLQDNVTYKVFPHEERLTIDHFSAPDRRISFVPSRLTLEIMGGEVVEVRDASFEFPRRDLPASVRFVGTLPIIANQTPLPPWADELDGSRKVVLVTQGTVANYDFGQLVAPTLAALANEPDVLVVVTAGGRPVDAIPGPLPSNARAASYLPFEWALAKADVLVTNGGYGSVNQALSFGVPLVTAGLTEDKADINVRVAWSGVGINLATDEPTSEALREAVRAVLDKPNYRARALAMAQEFSSIDTRSEILRILEQISGIPGTDGGRRVA